MSRRASAARVPERAGQRRRAAVRPDANGAGTQPELRGDLGHRQAVESVQRDDLARARGQRRDRGAEASALVVPALGVHPLRLGVRARGLDRLDDAATVVPLLAADAVDRGVAGDAEAPAHQGVAGTPGLAAAESVAGEVHTQQGFLDDVLGEAGGLDLNLFVVLRAVLDEGSATAAAKRLHVTQSAVSNALARLRSLLGDPLVVRNGRGLTATPRARELRAALDGALGGLAGIVAPQGFEPTASTRTFTLSLTDSYELSDLPRLVERFRRAMPRAQLRIITPERLIAMGGMASAEVDAAVVPEALVQPGVHKTRLWDEAAIVVARRDHPKLGRRISLEQFSRLPFVDVRVVGEDGIGARLAKAHFARLGITRNVAIIVPHFHAVAIAVAHSDCIGTLPERFATAIAELLPLRALVLPFPDVNFSMSLAWHERTDRDAGAQYFRGLVLETFGAGLPRPRRAAAGTPAVGVPARSVPARRSGRR